MKTNLFSWQNKIKSSVLQGDTFLLPLGFVGVTIYAVFMLGHLTCVENRVCNSLKVIQMFMIHKGGLISEYIIIISVFSKKYSLFFVKSTYFVTIHSKYNDLFFQIYKNCSEIQNPSFEKF